VSETTARRKVAGGWMLPRLETLAGRWLGRPAAWVEAVMVHCLGSLLRPLALQPQAIYGVYVPDGTLEERWALEGELVAFSRFPLLYLRPETGRWVLQPVPGARPAHLFYRQAGGGPLQPLAAPTLRAERGLVIWDARAHAGLVLFPGRPPGAEEAEKLERLREWAAESGGYPLCGWMGERARWQSAERQDQDVPRPTPCAPRRRPNA
jgi:hypothetical protein